MPMLLARGNETRIAIVKQLLAKPNSTEEELEQATQLSKSSVRAVLGRLDQAGLALHERARVPGKRGPGPLVYRLAEGLDSAEQVMERLHSWAETTRIQDLAKPTAAPEAAPPSPVATATVAHQPAMAGRTEQVFVLAKAGTNDVVLTKDGRFLLVEERVREKSLQRYRAILKGEELEALSLAEFRRRFPT